MHAGVHGGTAVRLIGGRPTPVKARRAEGRIGFVRARRTRGGRKGGTKRARRSSGHGEPSSAAMAPRWRDRPIGPYRCESADTKGSTGKRRSRRSRSREQFGAGGAAAVLGHVELRRRTAVALRARAGGEANWRGGRGQLLGSTVLEAWRGRGGHSVPPDSQRRRCTTTRRRGLPRSERARAGEREASVREQVGPATTVGRKRGGGPISQKIIFLF
jgi:hypothetical protein